MGYQSGFTYLSVDTCHRTSCHAISDATTHIELVTQKILKATIAKLEELV